MTLRPPRGAAGRRGKPLAPEHRLAIGRGVRRHLEVKARRAKVTPSDLLRLRDSGTVAPRLAPFLESAAAEAAELLEALGGPDHVSPQRRALVEDVARLGLVLRGEIARYAQNGDSDAASRVSTLASARRASLVALGLDRFERELDLGEYLRQRAARQADAGGASAGLPDPAAAALAKRTVVGLSEREESDAEEDEGPPPLDLRNVPRDLPRREDSPEDEPR